MRLFKANDVIGTRNFCMISEHALLLRDTSNVSPSLIFFLALLNYSRFSLQVLYVSFISLGDLASSLSLLPSRLSVISVLQTTFCKCRL